MASLNLVRAHKLLFHSYLSLLIAMDKREGHFLEFMKTEDFSYKKNIGLLAYTTNDSNGRKLPLGTTDSLASYLSVLHYITSGSTQRRRWTRCLWLAVVTYADTPTLHSRFFFSLHYLLQRQEQRRRTQQQPTWHHHHKRYSSCR